jgi:hypothetical protein
VILYHQHYQYFRTFGQNYLKQRHFELFTKSGEFYSLDLSQDPDPALVFFQRSDPDPVQHGPDPLTPIKRLVDTAKVTRALNWTSE